jgi:hypothetical protein
MATNTTFDTLTQDITRYVERGSSAASDPAVFAQIPRLINQTERKIMNALKLQGTIESLTDVTGLAANVSVVTKPDRWRNTISMFFGTGINQNSRAPLFARGLEYCRSYWPDATATAQPEFYADYDLAHWLVVPTPDVTYPLEALLYMQPVYLDAANQTNFFTNYAPNALLKGCLLETAEFLKDVNAIAEFRDAWQFEMSTLEGQDMQRILDRAAERKSA